MEFYNRISEIKRLKKSLSRQTPELIIIYGRRRCGKSALLKRILKKHDIYFLAHLANESLQRAQFASVISEKVPGFDQLIYPNWESLFTNLNNSLKEALTICIDEFPYLVKRSPGLPSLIQKIVDNSTNRKYHIVLCGSSQQMMHSLVLDSSSPLYGRASEILKIGPLTAGWLPDAIKCNSRQAVEEYAVWGGVPRYWEIRSKEPSFKDALQNIILDRHGILHEEPTRLFLDDMRESVQAFSILSVVGMGINRLSEIAGRLNKPSTQLSRPIDKLIQLGYLKREIPFGESSKSTKKSLYRIADPYMNFYFSFVEMNLSRLEMGMKKQVFNQIADKLKHFFAAEWENLCRNCVPYKPINGIYFDMPSRWWGANTERKPMEIDLVAESIDKEYLLVGECKWSKISNPDKLINDLNEKAKKLPFANNKKIIPILFVKELNQNSSKNTNSFEPHDVLGRLKH